MPRVIGAMVVFLAAVWVVAHVLYLGPIQDAAEVTLTWVLGTSAVCALVAALTVLGFGLLQGRRQPAWLRFVQVARTTTAIVGGALIVVGLLHYRDTEPRGDVQWLALGLIVLAGAGLVHLWVVRTERGRLS